MDQSSKPFPATLRKILEDEEVSQRELARRTIRHGWGSMAAINLLYLGKLTPTIEAMEAISTALKIPPETFAEYRLAVVRRSLDPSQVGLRRALKALDGHS